MDKNKIKVEVIRLPEENDWVRCKKLALNTIGKKFLKTQVAEQWKRNILKSEHSPIRTLMFTIQMEIPYYVSNHFVRHKIGVEHYVSSQRNDRQDKYDREIATQDMMVTHIMDINVSSLMSVARRRLCAQADPVTRYTMYKIVEAICEKDNKYREFLVPMCLYQHACPEFKSCGYYENLIKRHE